MARRIVVPSAKMMIPLEIRDLDGSLKSRDDQNLDHILGSPDDEWYNLGILPVRVLGILAVHVLGILEAPPERSHIVLEAHHVVPLDVRGFSVLQVLCR